MLLVGGLHGTSPEPSASAPKAAERPAPSVSPSPSPVRLQRSTSELTAEELRVPTPVIIELLQREVLLTKAKIYTIRFEAQDLHRKLRTLKRELSYGEPQFERLKRELEEVKSQPRGLEGTFRSAAEMERQRALAADAAIEEQIEVQTSFREMGQRLQKAYESRQLTEQHIRRKDQEQMQLNKWTESTNKLIWDLEKEVSGPLPLHAATSCRGAGPNRPPSRRRRCRT